MCLCVTTDLQVSYFLDVPSASLKCCRSDTQVGWPTLEDPVWSAFHHILCLLSATDPERHTQSKIPLWTHLSVWKTSPAAFFCFYWQVWIWDIEAVYPPFEPHMVSTSLTIKCKLLLIVAKAVQIPLQNSSHLIAAKTLLMGNCGHWTLTCAFHCTWWQSEFIQRLEARNRKSDSCTCRLRLIRLFIRGSILPPCGQPYSVL